MSILDFFKPKKQAVEIAPILPEQIYAEGVLELKDIIAPSALKVTPREINLGEKIARTFFVISYPRFLNEGWFAPIINLSKVFDISIFIHPIDTGSILRNSAKRSLRWKVRSIRVSKRAWCATPCSTPRTAILKNSETTSNRQTSASLT